METTILTSAQVEASLKRMCEEHGKNTDYRMQNYFNCVDDYSWGGICDQAQAQKENMMRRVVERLKEQEENGGYINITATELELQTLDGEFVSNNIINGRYGACFMFGTEETGFKFVGMAKKQSTFEKKGFRVVSKNYGLKVIYTGRLTAKGNAERLVELVSVTKTIDPVIDIKIDNKDYNLYILKTA